MDRRPHISAPDAESWGFGTRLADGAPSDWNDDLWATDPRGLAILPPGSEDVTLVLPRFLPAAAAAQEPAPPRPLPEILAPFLIAAFQIALTWRVVGGASLADQGAMVRAGHQEIAYLLHGRHIIRYETVLPGAPLLYPVAAAMLDAAGGITAVRVVSLAFAVLASVGVYCTARRLYGALAGAFAGGLFAGLTATLHLSAAGTYDAPAVCLLVWAAYFAVRFANADDRNAVWLAPVLMLAANWTSYITVLWDPVIVALVAAAGPGYDAWMAPRAWNAQRFALVAGVLAEITVLIGRAPAYTGIAATVMDRSAARSSEGYVLDHVGTWLGPVLALALLGVAATGWSASRGRASRAELAVQAVLAAGGLLALLNQLRWHSLDSAISHSALGGAFAAVAAGGFLARLCKRLGGAGALRFAAVAAALGAVLLPLGCLGVSQAAGHAPAPSPVKAGIVRAGAVKAAR
jgi:hypothetical protein